MLKPQKFSCKKQIFFHIFTFLFFFIFEQFIGYALPVNNDLIIEIFHLNNLICHLMNLVPYKSVQSYCQYQWIPVYQIKQLQPNQVYADSVTEFHLVVLYLKKKKTKQNRNFFLFFLHNLKINIVILPFFLKFLLERKFL